MTKKKYKMFSLLNYEKNYLYLRAFIIYYVLGNFNKKGTKNIFNIFSKNQLNLLSHSLLCAAYFFHSQIVKCQNSIRKDRNKCYYSNVTLI